MSPEYLIAYGILYGGFNTRRYMYTLAHSFCFFKLFPIGCIGLIVPLTISPVGLLDGLQFTLPGYTVDSVSQPIACVRLS